MNNFSKEVYKILSYVYDYTPVTKIHHITGLFDSIGAYKKNDYYTFKTVDAEKINNNHIFSIIADKCLMARNLLKPAFKKVNDSVLKIDFTKQDLLQNLYLVIPSYTKYSKEVLEMFGVGVIRFDKKLTREVKYAPEKVVDFQKIAEDNARNYNGKTDLKTALKEFAPKFTGEKVLPITTIKNGELKINIEGLAIDEDGKVNLVVYHPNSRIISSLKRDAGLALSFETPLIELVSKSARILEDREKVDNYIRNINTAASLDELVSEVIID